MTVVPAPYARCVIAPQAEGVNGDTATDRVRLLGPDHPDTLTARDQLASWRAR
jgi:hypothetical protein